MDNAPLLQPHLNLHMGNYQQQLKQKYMSMEFVSPFEMLDCFSANYIELSLKEERYGDSRYVTLHEVLEVSKIKGEIIIFEGNPGVGKSTLAIHICKCWANGDLLQGFDAVILLPLHDPEIQEAKNIKDLLLILDDDMREGVYKEIVKCNGKKICFILEGYDELPKKCTGQFSLFSKLKEKLPKCTLLYTSRPSHIKKYFSRVITVDGFEEESIDKYISSTFENVKNGKELAGELKSQLCNNPMVKSILHVPINLAIVCLVFFHYSTLPETLTMLYTLLCLRLIFRHIITRTPNVEGIEELISLNDLPESISEQFFQLCVLAYRSMESGTVMFYFKDLHGIGVNEGKLSCLGMLQITSVASVYGRQKSYNFLHLTLRDFCTAWYISKLSSKEQMKFLKTSYYDDQYEMVWRFYSGITGLKDREILDFMLPCRLVKSESTNLKMIKLMHKVYEAHDDEVCRIVGDHCDGSFVALYPEQLRFVTYSFNNHVELLQALCYLLIHYKGMLKHFDISTWPITDRELTIIVNALQTRKLQQNSVTSDKLTFKVFMEHITDKLHSLLVNLLTLPNTLHVLDISGIEIRTKEATFLAGCRNILLNDLRMSGCKLDSMGADKIGEMLAHNKSIISIDLSNNNVGDKGIERMVYHLKNGSSLQYINLCDNNITAFGIGHLRELLVANSTLTSLDISHDILSYEDICLFLKSLSNTMEYVRLYGYHFISAKDALHEVTSFGFINNLDNYKSLDISKPVITFIQHLEICVSWSWSTISDELETYKRIIEVISDRDNIQVLKIHYSLFFPINALQILSSYVKQSQSLKELNIHVSKSQCPPTVGDVVKLLTVNTSIRKFKCSGLVFDISSLEFRKLLTDLSDVLEELTLNQDMMRKGMESIVETLQEINQLRSIKGASNPLQLKIDRRHAFEGFYSSSLGMGTRGHLRNRYPFD